LSDSPAGEEVQRLAVFGEDTLGGVEAAEVGGTVDDDALDGDEEAAVKTDGTVRLEDLNQAIQQAVEFTRASPSCF
jgi:hypothetical protein